MSGRKKTRGLYAAGIIIRMAITFLVLIFLGDLLDRTLRTPPWFLLAGIILSVAIIIADLIRMAKGRKRR